jgi:hypothetical protein
MDRMEFLERWQLISDGTIPIPHQFKHSLPERWFRIHSLPESRRYADNEAHWEILLDRQNMLACRVFPPDATVFAMVGEYINLSGEESSDIPLTDIASLQILPLVPLVQIDLHAYSPEEYSEGLQYNLYFAEVRWQAKKYDSILRDIADDVIRAFWVSFETGVIFAPYDGGVDVIMPTTQARNAMRTVYKDWLSPRADGM